MARTNRIIQGKNFLSIDVIKKKIDKKLQDENSSKVIPASDCRAEFVFRCY